MGVEEIIALGILSYCGLIMVVIGISNRKSKKPVGFWSGQKPPAECEISDIASYNRKHGNMWILYGVGMDVAYLLGKLAEVLSHNEMLPYFLVVAEIVLGLAGMIWYHGRLDREYRKRKNR